MSADVIKAASGGPLAFLAFATGLAVLIALYFFTKEDKRSKAFVLFGAVFVLAVAVAVAMRFGPSQPAKGEPSKNNPPPTERAEIPIAAKPQPAGDHAPEVMAKGDHPTAIKTVNGNVTIN